MLYLSALNKHSWDILESIISRYIFLNSYSSEFRKVRRSKSEFSYPIFHDENDDGDEGNGDGEHGRQLNNEKPLEKK